MAARSSFKVLLVGFVAALVGLAAAAQPAPAAQGASSQQQQQQQQQSRPVSARQVSPSAWFVQGEAALGSRANRNFISNAGFIVTPAGVVVIDALGSPVLARELLAQIARITPKPVTHVILTHYHADHIYGLQEFRQRGARILAQRDALEYIHSDTAKSRLQASRTELAPWIDEKTHLILPDQWVDGRTELTIGGQRIVLQPVGPAHTPEDLVVSLPSEGVLFSGDMVFRGRVPFVGKADSGHWIAALDTLLAMKPKVVVPGHGDLSTTPQQDLQLTRDYLAYLRKTMGDAAREMDPFEEAYARTDWSRFQHMPLFREANRMNAYNTYLLMEQQPR